MGVSPSKKSVKAAITRETSENSLPKFKRNQLFLNDSGPVTINRQISKSHLHGLVTDRSK
jgi:hypothetical protein